MSTIAFSIPTALAVQQSLTLSGLFVAPTGTNRLQMGSDFTLNLSDSGNLAQQIALAAGVLGINGATGLVTFTGAPYGNYVTVSQSGATTFYVSGVATPNLSGVLFPGSGRISGDGNNVYVTPNGGILAIGGSGPGLYTVANADLGFGKQLSTTLMTLKAGGQLTIGTATDSLNGLLQLVTHTVSGGGIGLGPDVTLWRTAAKSLQTDSSFTTNNGLGGGGGYVQLSANMAQVFGPNIATVRVTQSGQHDWDWAASGGNFLSRVDGGAPLLLLTPGGTLIGTSGIFFRDTGNYTASGAASVAQLIAASGNTQLVSGLVLAGGGRISGDGPGSIYLNSGGLGATFNYNAFIGGFAGFWLKQGSPSSSNYALASDGTDLLANAPTNGRVVLRVNNADALLIGANRVASFASGLFFTDTGNYTLSGAASISQLLATSGWLTNSATSNVVYTTGAQTITGLKTWNSGVFWNSVGINTGTPSYPLYVVGNVANSSLGSVAVFENQLNAAGYINAFSAVAPNVNANGHVAFGVGRNAANNNIASLGFKYVSDGSTSNAFDVSFFGGNPLLTLLAGGNVGVGTGAPNTRLEVVDTSTYQLYLTYDTSNRTRFKTDSAGSLILGNAGADLIKLTQNIAGGTVYGGWAYTDANRDFALQSAAGKNIALIVNGGSVPSLFVSGNGMVGIGTTTPATLLQITATGGGALVNYATVRYNSSVNVWDAGVGATADTSVSGKFYFYDGAATRVVFQSGGNVGIGTTAPQALLHVSGGNLRVDGVTTLGPNQTTPIVPLGMVDVTAFLHATLPSGLVVRRNANQYLHFHEVDGSAHQIDGIGDKPIRIRNGATTASVNTLELYGNNAATLEMVVSCSGNVGIGIAVPAALLHVSGGVVRGEAQAYFGVTGGNVGIGTTTPAYKLEVSGSFGATTKSFDITHPTRPGYRLVHGVTESNQHSVFHRGRLCGSGFIQLPSYWEGLVHEESITVDLTAAGLSQRLYLGATALSGVFVRNELDVPVRAHYVVWGERKDVPRLVPEVAATTEGA